MTQPVQWAWEFLRRRADYQQDYETIVRPVLDDDGSIGDGRTLHLILERYGLIFPMNPAERTALDPLFADNFVSEVTDHGYGPQHIEVKAGEVLISFDLNQPLAAQLQRASIVLEADQRHYLRKAGRVLLKFRERSQKWPLYLRLLDAEAAGAPTAAIASRLFQGLDNSDPDYAASTAVRRSLKAAKRLQDKWRAIASLSKPYK